MRVSITVSGVLVLTLSLLTAHGYAQTSRQVTASDLQGLTITMKRDECFGPCPIYTVSLDGDGAVQYEGTRFVKVIGKRSYRIPVADVRDLVQAFLDADFFSLEESYRTKKNADGTETVVTDLPTTTITLTMGGRTKSVVDYYGTPESVIRLEDRIDAVARTKRYIARR